MPQWLPPLSESDYQNLRNSIHRDGQRVPILVNRRTGEIVDGFHRQRVCKELAIEPIYQELDLDEREAARLQVTLNVGRRHLSFEQKRELIKTLRIMGFPQDEIAEMVGITQGRVSQIQSISIINSNNAYIPDLRIKISPQAKDEIVQQLESGKTQEQVAANHDVSQPRVNQIHQQVRKAREQREQRENAVQSIADLDIRLGDFRELAQSIPDASVDLIFTDPPYDEAALPLYGDLALLAARVLRPGGWCLAYSGQAWLYEAQQQMAHHLTYGWTFAIQHTGGDGRIRKYKVQNKWKPILGFYRPPLEAWWDWFPDLVSGHKEKDEHEWQQAVAEATHYIQALSPSGGIILDPMMGSGTTCIAALRAGRQWIGIDQDPEAVAPAIQRLAEERSTQI